MTMSSKFNMLVLAFMFGAAVLSSASGPGPGSGSSGKGGGNSGGRNGSAASTTSKSGGNNANEHGAAPGGNQAGNNQADDKRKLRSLKAVSIPGPTATWRSLPFHIPRRFLHHSRFGMPCKQK